MSKKLPDPFGKRTRGKPWNITSAEEVWASIPATVTIPGFGCFQYPLQPVGFPLVNSTSTDPSVICPKGFFCPYLDVSKRATYPVACPPDNQCFFYRGYGFQCPNPQGLFEPMVCPRGFFCPSYNQIDVCPAGSYCLTGSAAPTPCEFLSICRVGTYVQQHFGLILAVAVADVLLLVVFVILRLREFQRANPGTGIFGSKGNSAKAIPGDDQDAASAIDKEKSLQVDQIENNILALTAGFQSGLDGHSDLAMNYAFENLGLRLPEGKEILQGVSGRIQAGRMTAIMGPSGAGKTTFMNVLMGKAARTSGILKINDSVAEMQQYRKIIGYVPQEDIMIEELSVRENIRYAARSRLPNSWSNKQVDDHVEAILTALNLNHVAHTRIGSTLDRGISGGQRKRVNIGMELAAAPLSVFLDEPTSGLDSTAAMDVTNILHSISRLGLTVVAVIHQPRVEIFETFDDVLMIAPGGLTAYFGPISGAQAYFESIGFSFRSNSNVADTLMDILSGRGELKQDVPRTRAAMGEIVDQWKSYAQKDTDAGNAESRVSNIESMISVAKLRGASFLRQIGLSHNRAIMQQNRLASAFMLELFVGVLSGMIMGIATGGGETFAGRFVAPFTALSPSPRYWFMSLYGMLIGLAIALASAPAGVKVFGEEKPVYLREAEAGHSSLAYFIGKNLSTVYRIVLASAHFAGFYVFFAQPPIGVGYQWSLIFLNFFGVYGMGMIISMLVRRENAPLIAVTIALISEVLCGFGPSLTDATKGGYVFLYNIGVNRWMAEAQYALWATPYLSTVDAEDISGWVGYEFGNTTKNLLIMFGLGLVYRAIAYLLFLVVLKSGYFKNMWVMVKRQFRGKKSGVTGP
ncbi:hypothetical protein CcCBS67573_g00435 [Chytriomyces confervae]|uniref:ABC transporter domain-containing protein n=1 Tax=Chytriomyces confervae TaxID=246404 RepID=A0A507FPP1_9FUNG|nr:hypothetical protein HDU80_007387 [Chytriomyces hyalinus]TPX78242.1 hypothetical protein CcCBS67573_g00435 [Chytriomyces confervae]